MAEKKVIRQEVIEEEEPKKKRNFIIGILLLIIAGIAIVGFSIAFFSDVLFGGGTATAGTLDLTAGDTKVAFQISTPGSIEETSVGANDGETINDLMASPGGGDAISAGNLNPGDFIDFSYTLTNDGTKSAWLRNKFTANVTFSPRVGIVQINPEALPGPLVVNSGNVGAFRFYQIPGDGLLYVDDEDETGTQCTTTYNSKTITMKSLRDTIRGTSNDFTTLLPTPKTTGFLGSSPGYTVGIANEAVGEPQVIDGTEEKEPGVAIEGNPTVHLLLYFDKAATNVYQAATMLFTFRTEAVQYRNNPNGNADPGTQTALYEAAWADATALNTEFSLGSTTP